MNQQETAEVTKVLDALRARFDSETAQIQTARKAQIPGLLIQRDDTQGMIRALSALVENNG